MQKSVTKDWISRKKCFIPFGSGGVKSFYFHLLSCLILKKQKKNPPCWLFVLDESWQEDKKFSFEWSTRKTTRSFLSCSESEIFKLFWLWDPFKSQTLQQHLAQQRKITQFQRNWCLHLAIYNQFSVKSCYFGQSDDFIVIQPSNTMLLAAAL